MGGWHDLSRDLRLHLLEEQKCLSQGHQMTSLLLLLLLAVMQILPFFFHLLVKCSHVKRLQLPQRRCDQFKHCDSEQCELRTEVWSKRSLTHLYMCSRSRGGTASFWVNRRKEEVQGNDASMPCRYQPNTQRWALSGVGFKFGDANANNCGCGKFWTRQMSLVKSYRKNMLFN